MPTDSRTASPSPLSPSSLLADESALKRAFDAEFESCLAAAKSQLGDATALAPRVVEGAFTNLWAKRATIATNQQLKDALAEEIRHGSARALSRRHSASRFAGGKHAQTGQHATTSATPADVWAHVEHAIKGNGSDQTHAAVNEAGRHEAASHMKAVAKKRSFAVPIAIGVAALIISVVGIIYVDRLGEDDAVLAAVSNSGIQPVQASVGQIGTVTLSDGTVMRIGPETKYFKPDGFPDKVHALRVDGTADFTVAPTAKEALPFRVVVKRNHIISTGTHFAVSGYSDDSGVVVWVKEGTVTVKSGKASSIVNAGQAVMLDNGAIRPATDAERAERVGWVDDTITVSHKQLRKAVEVLTRWFNSDVKVPDLTLLDRDASISAPLDSSRLAISQVEQSANVQFAYEGIAKVFRDAPKKAAAPAKPAASKKKR